MIATYLKIALRNLLSNKLFSAIKIGGLAVGLMVCMLILLYTKDEISYDRFHANAANIYRIVQTMQLGKDKPFSIGITQNPLGPAFKKEIPGIDQFVRQNQIETTIKQGTKIYNENPLFVDSNFFSVFSFPLIYGNRNNPLDDVHSIVLSKEAAKKYFPLMGADAVGQTLELKMSDSFEVFKVTAIAEDAPQNSSLRFDFLVPIAYANRNDKNHGWLGGSVNTFLLLSSKANKEQVLWKMQSVFEENTKDQIQHAKQEMGVEASDKLGLQPFTDIHLSEKYGTDNGLNEGNSPTYSYILSAIAIFILVIACINFINLAVAQSLKRSREIGIRKVIGGTRKQLIWQFLIESFLVSLFAFGIAIILTYVFLPEFNLLSGKKLSLAYLSDYKLYLGYLALLLMTSILAGIYPSLFLSAFKPVSVLYSNRKLMGKNYFTRGLIVLQFALAIFLIIGTIAVYSQLSFVFHKDLGYDPKNLLKIDLPFSKSNDQILSLFKNRLEGEHSIIGIAGRNRGRTMSGAKVLGREIIFDLSNIDEHYLPIFKIPILAGRNFSPDFPGDSLHSAIINENFVKEAGWTIESAIGKSIDLPDDKIKVTVIGVVKDYHFLNLREKIMSQIFMVRSPERTGQIWVKIRPDNMLQTLARIEKVYKDLSPFYPYSYQFMNDIIAKNYETETKWKEILGIAAIMFVGISCMGLFGLVIISVDQRTKEIGIRKVLGAAINSIVLIISKQFVWLIILAFMIAAPFGYWAVHAWLQHFAYRVDIQWWIFGISGGLVLLIALCTIGVKAILAARANPVKSLRTE
jgi:ABC-type antimicrobial peptide transport system permease subunit